MFRGINAPPVKLTHARLDLTTTALPPWESADQHHMNGIQRAGVSPSPDSHVEKTYLLSFFYINGKNLKIVVPHEVLFFYAEFIFI